jgi:hypothetical protein
MRRKCQKGWSKSFNRTGSLMGSTQGSHLGFKYAKTDASYSKTKCVVLVTAERRLRMRSLHGRASGGADFANTQ